jgi:hypothetical protein
MKDEKNKQQRQQPQERETGQNKASGQPNQGKQSSEHQPTGKQPAGQQHSGQQPTGHHPAGEDPARKSQRQPKKEGMEQPMDVNEGDMRGDIENPDQQEKPGKKVNIDDDPDQTKKKVPNMHK